MTLPVSGSSQGFLHGLAALGRVDDFARLVKKRDGSEYRRVGRALMDADIAQHLTGEQPIGIYVLAGDRTRVGVIDLDDHAGTGGWPQMAETATAVAAALRRHGILSHAFRSGGGKGIHLFIPFAQPQNAAAIRSFLQCALGEVDLAEGTRGVSEGDAEIFPKQEVVDPGGFGSLIALPLARQSVPLDRNMQPVAVGGRELALSLNGDLTGDGDWAVGQAAAPDRAVDADEEQVASALKYVDASDYGLWVLIGLILKAAFGDGGLAIWTEWSRGAGEKFAGEAGCKEKWRTFKPRGRTGLGTLFHYARAGGWSGPISAGARGTNTRPSIPLRRHIISARALVALELPPQDYLIEEWLPVSGLAMVWAARGLGKTWFGLSLAICVAKGEDFLAYKVPRPRVVLYVDGEMRLDDLQRRIHGLSRPLPEELHVLPSQHLFREGTPLNIHAESDQQRILEALEDLDREGMKPDLLVLDNLSSLTSGVDENDNSAQDQIQRFLLMLRHQGITVLVVHHANKANEQRGASRREDLLDTSIKLDKPKAEGAPHDGAHFVMEFTKNRGRTPKPRSLELKLIELPTGELVWSSSHPAAADPKDQVLRDVALHAPKKQAEIADRLGKTPSAISKDLTALVQRGYLTRKPLGLTESGAERVVALWPDLREVLAKEGNIPF